MELLIPSTSVSYLPVLVSGDRVFHSGDLDWRNTPWPYSVLHALVEWPSFTLPDYFCCVFITCDLDVCQFYSGAIAALYSLTFS